MNPNSTLLTNTQKAVLAIVLNAPTPEVAFENTNDTQALITARNLLKQLGFIVIANNTITLTPSGQDIIVSNNISDSEGNITDEGEQLIASINQTRPMVEAFELLKTLI